MVIALQENISAIDAVLPFLPERLRLAVMRFPQIGEIEEIRLRAGQPFCITVAGQSLFLGQGGEFSKRPAACCWADKGEIESVVRLFCSGSVYAHSKQINEGFLPAPAGCRVGVSGDFSGEALTEFSGINIRIAHEIKGAANRIFEEYFGGGVLLAGPPASGKTTILRDAVRQLSAIKRISLVDTRGEISGYSFGRAAMDIGQNTDLFFGGAPDKCIEIALRCFSPEIICIDEIGSEAHLAAIRQSFNAGADIITTAHAKDKKDFLCRPVLRQLLDSGAIKRVYILNCRDLYNAEVFCREELMNG